MGDVVGTPSDHNSEILALVTTSNQNRKNRPFRMEAENNEKMSTPLAMIIGARKDNVFTKLCRAISMYLLVC